MRSVPSAGKVDRWADPDSLPVRIRSARHAYARALGACVLALLALAGSTSTLSWYGGQSPTATLPGPFDITSGVTATSHWLTPESGLPWMRPGGQGWGYLLLASSLGMAVVALVVLLMAWFGGVERLRISVLSAGVATASIVLDVLVGLALPARPPLGAGPPMVLDWGAVIGFLLAVTCSVAAWWAFAVCETRRRSSRRRPEDLEVT